MTESPDFYLSKGHTNYANLVKMMRRIVGWSRPIRIHPRPTGSRGVRVEVKGRKENDRPRSKPLNRPLVALRVPGYGFEVNAFLSENGHLLQQDFVTCYESELN